MHMLKETVNSVLVITSLRHPSTLTQLGTAYRLNTSVCLLVDEGLAWALAAVHNANGNTCDECFGIGTSLLAG